MLPSRKSSAVDSPPSLRVDDDDDDDEEKEVGIARNLMRSLGGSGIARSPQRECNWRSARIISHPSMEHRQSRSPKIISHPGVPSQIKFR